MSKWEDARAYFIGNKGNSGNETEEERALSEGDSKNYQE